MENRPNRNRHGLPMWKTSMMLTPRFAKILSTICLARNRTITPSPTAIFAIKKTICHLGFDDPRLVIQSPEPQAP